ncbi:hypothetical protein B0H63DRAFT_543664 [Podospora didyma]|uniref:F-box domain-containing protein n=1 Tax=Podospora didyma TaxID=330526 RepID=A0AAE0TZR0_9PEZI|nr:hypothetical protein B0H63DRAFT_543664 [Podospora didyma]
MAKLSSLPNEMLADIGSHLEEKELASLALTNRRMFSVAHPALWRQAFEDPLRARQLLHWATDKRRHDMLSRLLDHGVDPDTIYLSPILRSRLEDVFTAQGGHRGAFRPKDDHLLKVELCREKIARDIKFRNEVHEHFKRWGSESTCLQIPQDGVLRWPYNMSNALSHPYCDWKFFGPKTTNDDPENRFFWQWTPLHLATYLGDVDAVAMLLDHGADIEAQCRGLCGCSWPWTIGKTVNCWKDSSRQTVSPEKDRPAWTALHVAICSGHRQVADLLLERDASLIVGGVKYRGLRHADSKTTLTATALHSAAWLGLADACEWIIKSKGFNKTTLNKLDHSGRTALCLATNAGHIKTVAKLLIENGASLKFNSQNFINNPLAIICGQIDNCEDAIWFFEFLQNYDKDQAEGGKVGTLLSYSERRITYDRCLKDISDADGHPYHDTRWKVWKSLRTQQDGLESPPQEHEHSERSIEEVDRRITLARKLLALGANPNYVPDLRNLLSTRASPFFSDSRTTALLTAIQSGFAKMVKVLLDSGADANFKYSEKHPTGFYDGHIVTPLQLAITEAGKWTRLMDDESNKEAVQLVTHLLDNGASFDDGKVMIFLSKELSKATLDRYCSNPLHDDTVEKRLTSIAKLLLDRGIALPSNMKKEVWVKLLVGACTPGKVPFYKLLAERRTITAQELGRDNILTMLRKAAAPYKSSWRTTTEGDSDLARWILGLCIQKGQLQCITQADLVKVMKDIRKKKDHDTAASIGLFMMEKIKLQ